MHSTFAVEQAVAETHGPACLVTILHQDGSTPRTAGARMLVFPGTTGQPRLVGTIGGGLVEAEAITLALDAMASGTALTRRFDLSGRRELDMDMICGGRLEVLVEPMGEGSEPVRKAFDTMARHHTLHGRTVAMCTALEEEATGLVAVRRNVFVKEATGHWQPVEGGQAHEGMLPETQTAWELLPTEEGRVLMEVHAPPETLYLFGAGHVALATAQVAHVAGFRVVVLDDRPEFANAARYPMAARVLTPPDFDSVFAWEPFAQERMGPQSYLAILTRGHRHDATVLAQALGTAAGWIGMIGSRGKRDATYGRLREHGFGDADFARVQSPIGLPIGGDTPGEIAVSIVAQCIQHRSGKADADSQ